MAKIRIIVEDGDGTVAEKAYALPDNLDSLDKIDEAVEEFKNEALPQIEKELFAQAQQRSLSEVKKTVRDP